MMPPTRLSGVAAGPWNKTSAQLQNLERILTERLDRFALPLRGYAGWLLTNPQFIGEHDDLFTRHRGQILRFGIPQPTAVGGATSDSVFGRARQDSAGWVNDFREFCDRWRLQSLAGLNLPCPLPPQVPCLLPGLTRTAASPGSETVLIPDIFPVSGTGALTAALHAAVRGGSRPEHLAGWFRIVAKENAAKNVIGHLARLFRLQHYWRAMHLRHAAAVNRRRGRLISAFAGYLKVSDDSVRKDLHWIAKRLGRDWHLRADPLAPQCP